MVTIILFSQHLKIVSLPGCLENKHIKGRVVFLTPHFLFENERELLLNSFPGAEFFCFADFLTDDEMAKCDEEAFVDLSMAVEYYLQRIKRIKNERIYAKIQQAYPKHKGYLLSKDLGIDDEVWSKHGFETINGEYYYRYRKSSGLKSNIRDRLKKYGWLKKAYHVLKQQPIKKVEDVYCTHYKGKKYIFIGRMNRIDYRLNISFEASEEERDKFNRGEYEDKETCQYLTTWHEHWKCDVPDDPHYDVRWIQDGYLPPNYTDYGYNFIPDNVKYYAWDVLGTKLFHNRNLPVELIPFCKKLYLPQPCFPKEVKNILIVASGSGDWTALKNRSDDDLLVYAFAQMAKKFPDIDFVYRCHPTWIHPNNVGVHAIDRVQEYFSWLNLPNLHVSSHIPLQDATDGDFKLTFSRSSLEDDLKKADFVFGEHSISMIDAAFKQIPFCSVNMTNRRNFFIGITELGFPSASSHDEIANIIESASTPEFGEQYLKAVEAYNKMTDEEI